MQKRLFFLLCLALIALIAVKTLGQGSPRERGGPARQRGAARRLPPGAQLKGPTSKEDLDYQDMLNRKVF